MKSIFSWDGALVAWLTKAGELIVATVLWLLCCIPVITIIPATTSFYYAVIKSVRRERGYVWSEFFRSMKRTLLKGILLSVAILAWGFGLWYGRETSLAGAPEGGSFLLYVYDILIAVSCCVLVCFIPVFSRFELKLMELVKLSFVMTIRYLYWVIPILIGIIFLGWLIFMKLPMLTILFLPGFACYLITYPMEKMLLAFMKKAEGDEDAWYREEKIQGNNDNQE